MSLSSAILRRLFGILFSRFLLTLDLHVQKQWQFLLASAWIFVVAVGRIINVLIELLLGCLDQPVDNVKELVNNAKVSRMRSQLVESSAGSGDDTGCVSPWLF